MQEKFYGIKEIQEIFSIGRSKAIALMKTEGFPSIKLGRTYRVEAESLKKWIKENEGKAIHIGAEK